MMDLWENRNYIENMNGETNRKMIYLVFKHPYKNSELCDIDVMSNTTTEKQADKAGGWE